MISERLAASFRTIAEDANAQADRLLASSDLDTDLRAATVEAGRLEIRLATITEEIAAALYRR